MMKSVKKKTAKPDKKSIKTAAKKTAAKTVKKPAGISLKPLARISEKIRSKLANAKAVETAQAAASAGTKAKAIPEFEIRKTKIRVIGIGGGGGNIVSEIAQNLKKSTFYIANTDYQALRNAPKQVSVFQFGQSLTQGLGTGMDPRVAEEAASQDREKIRKMMEGQDLVVIVSALGGGTGSGAAPVFAQISKSLGNLTYGIFTLPFVFEGAKKSEIAKSALEKLRPHLNAITILPNERVFEVVPKATPFSKTLSYINSMLSDSLEGLIDTIYDTGLINIDFADLHAILSGSGKMAFLNTVSLKKGEKANLDSFEKAFGSPLYPYTIDKARGLLLNIVARKDLKLVEVNKILTTVANRIHKEARIIFGVGHEGADEDSVKVTVLATGCQYDGFGENGQIEAAKTAVAPNASQNPATGKPPAAAKPKPKKSKTAAVKKPVKNKNGKTKKTAPKSKPVPVKIKNNPAAAASPVAAAGPSAAGNPGPVPAPSETPGDIGLRKNALQVRKEIELEEKKMLENEKVWEIPAFLRKQKKN